jgi:hypothetical protein
MGVFGWAVIFAKDAVDYEKAAVRKCLCEKQKSVLVEMLL